MSIRNQSFFFLKPVYSFGHPQYSAVSGGRTTRRLATSLMVIRQKAIYRFRLAHILLGEIIQIIFLCRLGSSHGCQFDIFGYRRLKVIQVE